MNIYKVLNEITDYIEAHLQEKIDYKKLAKIMAVNVYTMQRIFHVITGITPAEYIRKRRLSMASFDLYKNKEKVIDVALKYQYDSATSFSRAFFKFHGIKPSEVKRKVYKFKNFPKMTFNENIEMENDISYEIISLEAMTLYGKKIKTTTKHIGKDAPLFFKQMRNKYSKTYGEIKYGMTAYEDHMQDIVKEYWVLWNHKIDEFEKIVIPKSKWLKFPVSTNEAIDIQKKIDDFYVKIYPSCAFNLRDLPDLEYYHDKKTDILVPIF